MINNDTDPEGIFVLNDKIFSIKDLIDVMIRNGIQIRLNQNGLTINGELISSINNLEDLKCPIANNCEKRIALLELLRLHRNQSMNNFKKIDEGYELTSSRLSNQFKQTNPESFSKKEENRRDFIRPNNHDLFEGNISEQQSNMEKQSQESMGLFDEPDLFSDRKKAQFDSLYYKEADSTKIDSQDDIAPNEKKFQENIEQPFCSVCGFDLKPNWISCPNCGHKILQKNIQNAKNYFY